MSKPKKELLTERIQMRITPSLRKAINATRGKGRNRKSFNRRGIDLWMFALWVMKEIPEIIKQKNNK